MKFILQLEKRLSCFNMFPLIRNLVMYFKNHSKSRIFSVAYYKIKNSLIRYIFKAFSFPHLISTSFPLPYPIKLSNSVVSTCCVFKMKQNKMFGKFPCSIPLRCQTYLTFVKGVGIPLSA